jgi:hypothetical protein
MPRQLGLELHRAIGKRAPARRGQGIVRHCRRKEAGSRAARKCRVAETGGTVAATEERGAARDRPGTERDLRHPVHVLSNLSEAISLNERLVHLECI